jgi:hypothetical protein
MKVKIEHQSSVGLWELSVIDRTVTVSLSDGDNIENRSYELPEEPQEIEYSNQHGMPYVYVCFLDRSFYQFKFEDGGNLIGDYFNERTEHIKPFAMHTFGENWVDSTQREDEDDEEDEEDEEDEDNWRTRCRDCTAMTVNGIYLHERGCPNDRKEWDAEEKKWVTPESEYDDYDEEDEWVTPESEYDDYDEEDDLAHESCYYNDGDTCRGYTWDCQTCGETYCEAHNHTTSLGTDVECVACERERKENDEEDD